ncbi:MAG: von Willebrand factor type A domain-containing protein [Candidatus Omnitrophica bacterium]|nr:von Willebrand factor type A domain-containing protein [Candidatus Omnitrophota bacterium]
MTDHQIWKQLLSAYFDDELSPEEKDTVNNHLIDCPACQKYLKELQSLSLNVKALKNEPLSPDLEQRLNNLNRTRTEGSTMQKTNFMNFLKTATPVVVVLFLAIFSIQMYSKRAMQARVRDASQYTPTQTLALGTTKQYQPYYESSNYSGRLRSAADDIGTQYNAGHTNIKKEMRAKEAAVDSMGVYAFQLKQLAEKETRAHSNMPSSVVVNGSAAMFASRTKSDENKVNWKDTATINYQRENYALKLQRGMINPAEKDYDSKTRSADEGYLQSQGYGIDKYPYAPIQIHESNTEQYDLINENEFLQVTENPLSTFSIDVDTASYANVRRFLNNTQMPPRDAVRIEEMINYFKYNYATPSWNQPFSINLEHGICPWNPAHQLVLVGLQGKELSARQTPISNLVFLIDVSGSMNSADKLPLLKESMKLMVQQLRPEERVSLVVYAGNAGLVLDSTPAHNKGLIMAAIDNLQAGGSTAGGQGIELAYAIAKKNFIHNGNNRVILATDGDFNVGVSSDSALVQMIEEKRKDNIFLTVLGFGTGNYQDGKMEKLANKGNGNYFYIDSINEGKKVLVDELGSTLIAIAKDVKIQIEFNPNAVKAYRLIGYENRKLAKEDFNDDTKDAGELGAGHTVTALYEIVPAGSWESTGGNVDPLKYQKQTSIKSSFTINKEMMTVKLRYKEPKSNTSKLITKILTQPTNTTNQRWFGASDNLQFASAVAEFGMLLRDSKFKANSSYTAIIQRAQMSAYTDPQNHKAEFISLVQKAASLDQRQPQSQVFQDPHQNYPVPTQGEGGYNQK